MSDFREVAARTKALNQRLVEELARGEAPTAAEGLRDLKAIRDLLKKHQATPKARPNNQAGNTVASTEKIAGWKRVVESALLTTEREYLVYYVDHPDAPPPPEDDEYRQLSEEVLELLRSAHIEAAPDAKELSRDIHPHVEVRPPVIRPPRIRIP